MTMPAPVLSIITPLYNREWCIADCIASVRLAGHAAEMIIVDDGSSDQSVARARAAAAALGISDQVIIDTQANAGPGAARNRAAALARGRWLVCLDSDDLWLPWTLTTLIAALETVPATVKLGFAQGRNFAQESELATLAPGAPQIHVAPSFVTATRRHRSMRFGACNAMIRRDEFVTLGGFPADLRCSEDSDLFLRVAGETLVITAPVLVGLRRAGHDSLTGNVAQVLAGVDWLLQQDAGSRYAGSAADRSSFMAGAAAYGIRVAFAGGHPGLAYRRYLASLGRLADVHTRGHLLRLPLTPLLHLLKPAVHPFRLAPPSKTSARG
jgi:hypothetical protein